MMNEEKLVRLLFERELKITFAESCTGGLLSAHLVNVAGASDVFEEGFVTYSEDAKIKRLGVSPETIEKHSVYSAQTAVEMASGAAKAAGADIAVAVSGIAGPTGFGPDFPVGLCYIACSYNGDTVCEEYHFYGDRQQIREKACSAAIDMACAVLEA